MPLNIPGILSPFQLLFRPYLVVPSLTIKDVRYLDFRALYKAGYRGAVFDKDNCLTIPHDDRLVPELKGAWEECRQVFGKENILVVSNSAGTRLDPGGIQAESVSYHLGVPVLRHDTMKPGYACIKSIRTYFASLPQPVSDDQLIIVGDRIFTDVVLANRMRKYSKWSQNSSSSLTRSIEKVEATSSLIDIKNSTQRTELEGPLAIFVEDIWKKEATTMRFLEKKLVQTICKWNDKFLEYSRELEKKCFIRNDVC